MIVLSEMSFWEVSINNKQTNPTKNRPVIPYDTPNSSKPTNKER
jgi:hypothetical protein